MQAERKGPIGEAAIFDHVAATQAALKVQTEILLGEEEEDARQDKEGEEWQEREVISSSLVNECTNNNQTHYLKVEIFQFSGVTTVSISECSMLPSPGPMPINWPQTVGHRERQLRKLPRATSQCSSLVPGFIAFRSCQAE